VKLKSDALEKHIFGIYFTLRIGIAVIAILLISDMQLRRPHNHTHAANAGKAIPAKK